MTLPDISKEYNFKISVRKFLFSIVNSFTPSIPLLLDTGLKAPTSESSAPKWIAVEFGSFIIGTVNEANINIYCCAQQDADADEVTLLRDIIVGNFTDSNSVDTIKRIPFYINLGTPFEEIIGYMVADIIYQSGYLVAADGTKYKLITINLKWGASY
jgi:hypothetical protein